MSKDQEASVVGDEQRPSASPIIDEGVVMRRAIEAQRRYRWRQRIARFVERNLIAWFFDEFPAQDMYVPDPQIRRTTRQDARYHRFRQRTGWTFLSYLGTSAGVRFAAIAGLVSAVFQAAPVLHPSGSTATAFRWLLISGAMYLCAAAWFELFCPLLLKQTLRSKEGGLGMHGRRWLRALVEDELRRWWARRTWKPHPALLDLSRMEDKSAVAIMSRYGDPAFAGFDVLACAHIDLALDEFSRSRNVKLWTPTEEGSERWKRHEAGYTLEGNRPLMQRLRIYRLSQHELEGQSEISERDLVVEWDRSGIAILNRLPTKRTIHVCREAEGLAHLFESDADARTFSTIVAGWQDTMHPLRRIVLFGLYLFSLVAFLCFIVSQVHTVAHGLLPL
ncbi:hypothetical protein [Ralstonia sp. UBA689]|uniref:hypothetical protein n=1 Tax=Ralstonia sp. UBA689 TaxID=1947373 RepID=UPI0025D2CB32|nr:hypothetical protein [Ralstonia sp. UBA689]